MDVTTDPDVGIKQTATAGSAIGRRVKVRRTSLGLTPERLAQRAGMSESYLEYVEGEHGHPSAGVVRRLAEALHTTVEHLYGEAVLEPVVHLARKVDRAHVIPPEQRHLVSRLDAQECLLLIGSVPIGRVAFVVNGPPLVLPVNFTLMGKEIVLQTAAMSPLAQAARAGRLVTFEVDDIDEPSRLGWSVLLHGPARLSTEKGPHDHHVHDLVRPWVGGDRSAVVVISPSRITGRRIGLA